MPADVRGRCEPGTPTTGTDDAGAAALGDGGCGAEANVAAASCAAGGMFQGPPSGAALPRAPCGVRTKLARPASTGCAGRGRGDGDGPSAVGGSTRSPPPTLYDRSDDGARSRGPAPSPGVRPSRPRAPLALPRRDGSAASCPPAALCAAAAPASLLVLGGALAVAVPAVGPAAAPAACGSRSADDLAGTAEGGPTEHGTGGGTSGAPAGLPVELVVVAAVAADEEAGCGMPRRPVDMLALLLRSRVPAAAACGTDDAAADDRYDLASVG